MGTPARSSLTNWKLGPHYPWQAQHGWVGEYGISKPELSPLTAWLTAASISQIINSTVLQVTASPDAILTYLWRGCEANALWAEVPSAEPPLVELHSHVCIIISVCLHNQNENDYLNNIRDCTVSRDGNKFPFQITKTQYWKEVKGLWR